MLGPESSLNSGSCVRRSCDSATLQSEQVQRKVSVYVNGAEAERMTGKEAQVKGHTWGAHTQSSLEKMVF